MLRLWVYLLIRCEHLCAHTHPSKNHMQWYFYRIQSHNFCIAVMKTMCSKVHDAYEHVKRHQSNFLEGKQTNKPKPCTPVIHTNTTSSLTKGAAFLCSSVLVITLWTCVFSAWGIRQWFAQILVHLFSSYNKSDTGSLMMWNPADKMKPLASFCWQDHSDAMWKF